MNPIDMESSIIIPYKSDMLSFAISILIYANIEKEVGLDVWPMELAVSKTLTNEKTIWG